MLLPGIDIGIDLGTSSIQIITKERGIVLDEPAVVALDIDTDEIIAYGLDAYKMLGRTSERIRPIYPLKDGVISDYDLTEQMLMNFVEKVCGNRVFMPRVVVCVPINITEVERRAVSDALHSSGARKVCLIEEAIAAAIGAGIDISAPMGCMIVDIGGGTSDIAVLSLNGMASCDSIKMAGHAFDEAVIRYVKKKFNLLIGPRMAERVKINLGCAVPRNPVASMRVSGRSLLNGLPRFVTMTSDDAFEALEEPTILITRRIQQVLEQTAPELIGDILTNGVLLTGGSSQLYGMDKLVSKKTKLNAVLANDPQHCVALGCGKALKFMDSATEEEIALSPLDIYTF
ncbi:MAG: rod shape-determining protein [Oscillospiraceae bacterium]|nr:rod shape-determining protein [Oscillospiraceae bacterium]